MASERSVMVEESNSSLETMGTSDAQVQLEGAEASVQEFYDMTCGLYNTLYSMAQQQEEALLAQYKTGDDEQYADSEGDLDGQEQDYQEYE